MCFRTIQLVMDCDTIIPDILCNKLDCEGVKIVDRVKGGIVNEAVVVETVNMGKLFVKYSNRENVS